MGGDDDITDDPNEHPPGFISYEEAYTQLEIGLGWEQVDIAAVMFRLGWWGGVVETRGGSDYDPRDGMRLGSFRPEQALWKEEDLARFIGWAQSQVITTPQEDVPLTTPPAWPLLAAQAWIATRSAAAIVAMEAAHTKAHKLAILILARRSVRPEAMEAAQRDLRLALWNGHVKASGRKAKDDVARIPVPAGAWENLTWDASQPSDWTKRVPGAPPIAGWRDVVVPGDEVMARWPAPSRNTSAIAMEQPLERPVSDARLEEWYAQRVASWPASKRHPTRDEDVSAAQEHFKALGQTVTSARVHQVRKKHAPGSWQRAGKPKSG